MEINQVKISLISDFGNSIYRHKTLFTFKFFQILIENLYNNIFVLKVLDA